jgi:copper chaperone CopZ
MKIKVTNMTCQHCVRTIQMALIKNKIVADIHLEEQIIDVKSDVSESLVKTVIHEAGYETV